MPTSHGVGLFLGGLLLGAIGVLLGWQHARIYAILSGKGDGM